MSFRRDGINVMESVDDGAKESVRETRISCKLGPFPAGRNRPTINMKIFYRMIDGLARVRITTTGGGGDHVPKDCRVSLTLNHGPSSLPGKRSVFERLGGPAPGRRSIFERLCYSAPGRLSVFERLGVPTRIPTVVPDRVSYRGRGKSWWYERAQSVTTMKDRLDAEIDEFDVHRRQWKDVGDVRNMFDVFDRMNVIRAPVDYSIINIFK